MGILDQVISGIGGNASGGASPMQGVLSSLLGGNQGGAQGGAAGAATGGGMAGGLQGLMSKFEGAGLGGIAQSWVGNGANQPVSPEQLHGVLGDNQVQSMSVASRHGSARFPVATQPASAERRQRRDAERPFAGRRLRIGLARWPAAPCQHWPWFPCSSGSGRLRRPMPRTRWVIGCSRNRKPRDCHTTKAPWG